VNSFVRVLDYSSARVRVATSITTRELKYRPGGSYLVRQYHYYVMLAKSVTVQHMIIPGSTLYRYFPGRVTFMGKKFSDVDMFE
jgi:hypothetical protein